MPTRQDRIAEFTAMALGRTLATFDVFDTLLHRTCSPETILLHTCRKIAAALYLEVSTVRAARDRAVAALRSATFASGLDGEYQFSEFGPRFASELSAATGADIEIVAMEVDLALSDEIRMEHDCVYPDQAMLAAARQLAAAGRQVAAVSDMYHSRDTILSLLRKIGAGDLFNKDNVLVSSDYRMTKASGRLYGIVLERFGLPPEEVVHIGDNRGSDYVAAEDRGIRAFHYDAMAHHDRYRKDLVAQETGRDIGLAAHEAACTALDPSLLSHRLAASIAPVLCQFAQDVAERAKKLDVDSVWFMARDGYLPMRLYELFDDGTSPLAQYLYVSRNSVAKASSKAYGMREAFMAQWNGESRKLRTLLSPFELGDEAGLAAARHHGFASLDEEVDFATDPRFHKLLDNTILQSFFANDSARRKASLLKHLGKSGFMSQRHVAVVDVGWAGQIQEALELAIDGVPGRPHVTGLYMAVRGLGGYRRLAGHDLEGLIYDCSRHDWLAASIFNAVDVFEDTCRAHHGTVLGYDEAGDPVLATDTASRIEEMKDEPRLKNLQNAIMLYAARWISYVRMFGVAQDSTRATAILMAARLTRFPTADEASFFTSIGHSLDVGSDHLLGRKEITGRRIVPRIGHLRGARWKEAAAADYVWGLALQFLFGLKRQMTKVWDVPLPVDAKPFVKNPHAQCGLASSLPPHTSAESLQEQPQGHAAVGNVGRWRLFLSVIENMPLSRKRSRHLA